MFRARSLVRLDIGNMYYLQYDSLFIFIDFLILQYLTSMAESSG